MRLDLAARLKGYFLPASLIIIATYCTIVTLLKIIFKERQPLKVLSYDKWRDSAFKYTWQIVGPLAYRASATEIQEIVSRAYGTVLDVGPGEGLALKFLDRSKVTKVYGVEPNKEMHPVLREQISRCKLEDIYHIVPCGVDQLPNEHITPGSIDSILCVRVLCSIPEPRKTLKKLYDLLKPGGQMLVLEHHALSPNETMSLHWVLQGLYSLVWPSLLGGCELTRPTPKWLWEAGHWSTIKLNPVKDYTGYEVNPDITGHLVKAMD